MYKIVIKCFCNSDNLLCLATAVIFVVSIQFIVTVRLAKKSRTGWNEDWKNLASSIKRWMQKWCVSIFRCPYNDRLEIRSNLTKAEMSIPKHKTIELQHKSMVVICHRCFCFAAIYVQNEWLTMHKRHLIERGFHSMASMKATYRENKWWY